MESNISISKAFSIWRKLKRRVKIAFGGRGGSKSFSLGWLLLVESFNEANKNMIFLVARETLNSIEDSSYATLKAFIEEANLEDYFEITKTYIENKVTHVRFRFIGVREYGIKRVKSIHNIKYCYIDEAEDLSINSWTILEPSVRGEGSEIWVSFNPNQESDFSYSLIKPYLSKLKEHIFSKDKKEYRYYDYVDSDRYILKVNYYSNSFENEVLDQSRKLCLKNTPHLYNHVWLGETQKKIGRVFSQSGLKFYNYDYYKDNLEQHYVKRAIIDPAFGRENCFTSCVIYSRVGNEFYIIDAGLMRTDGVRTVDEMIKSFLLEYEVRDVMCEANFHQGELIKKLKRDFMVRPFYQRVDKIERIVDASIDIRERVLFDEASVNAPDGTDTEAWLKLREGRNFIGMMQLLNFSDIKTDNNKKGDDFSYIDFVDVVASLVKYDKRKENKGAPKQDIIAINTDKAYNIFDDTVSKIKSRRKVVRLSYD